MLKRNRPISPHLLIYSATLNLQRSIFHRFSGVILVLSFLTLILFTKFLINFSLNEFTQVTLLLYFSFLFFLKNLIFFIFGFHIFSGIQQIFTKT